MKAGDEVSITGTIITMSENHNPVIKINGSGKFLIKRSEVKPLVKVKKTEPKDLVPLEWLENYSANHTSVSLASKRTLEWALKVILDDWRKDHECR